MLNRRVKFFLFQFQRLSGKRKRGLEDSINFVDANVDDYVDPSEVSKHLTEETEYVSHKNKDNMPTAQQRRKKQITYLAYQVISFECLCSYVFINYHINHFICFINTKTILCLISVRETQKTWI